MNFKSTKFTKLAALFLVASFLFSFTPTGMMRAWSADKPNIEGLPDVVIVPENKFGTDIHELEINPDYIRWQNGEDFGDIIPEKYVYSVAPNQRAPRFASESAAKYDPRSENGDSNALTPAKNQGSLGTCWTFAATGALESYIERNSAGDTNPDYSEMNMAFAMSKKNEAANDNPYGLTSNVDAGGNVSYAAAYLTRQAMSGPVTEASDPYSSLSATRPLSTTQTKPRAGLVTGMVRLPDLTSGSPGSEVSGYSKGKIKSLIETYGAATVSYYSSQTNSSDGNGARK